MYSSLPDELVKEILSPALQISDKSFASTERRSPFAGYERSTSAYLLVCKDWLRVATPLLYNVVVLRSKGQIQALEQAIKSTPELGTFIKKLRIESSYCASLLKILTAAKNVTDICLSFEIYSQDNVVGLCRALPLIQPRRVILYDPISFRRGSNQQFRQLCDTLIQIIPQWHKLTIFVLPNWVSRHWAPYSGFIDALCHSKSVTEVALLSESSHHIVRLAKIPTIERIYVQRDDSVLLRRMLHRPLSPVPSIVKEHPNLAGLVTIVEDDDERAQRKTLSPTPCFLPSEWFDSCPDAVLENILSYAYGIPELQDPNYTKRQNPWQKCFSSAYRRGLSLVCKRFQAIALPLYYQCIIIHTEHDVAQLARRYQHKPELGKHTRSLLIAPFRPALGATFSSFASIFSLSPNLRRVVQVDDSCPGGPAETFDWQMLTALALGSGPQLADLQLHLRDCSLTQYPRPLYHFRGLKNLYWRSGVLLSVDPFSIPNDALYSLETLTCLTTNDSFLRVLTFMELPNIRTVRFPDVHRCDGALEFLEKHGSKLQCLEAGFLSGFQVFDVCLNVKTFIVAPHSYAPQSCLNLISENPTPSFFSCSQDHPLEELVIATRPSKDPRQYCGYLGTLNLSHFKSLRRIKVTQCYWPVTERDIQKSWWVQWAERFKDLYGVDMLDYSGKAWVPRLKPKGKMRRQ